MKNFAHFSGKLYTNLYILVTHCSLELHRQRRHRHPGPVHPYNNMLFTDQRNTVLLINPHPWISHLLTLCGPCAIWHTRHFDLWYLGDQKEVDDVLRWYQYLHGEIFRMQQFLLKNIEKQKRFDEMKVRFLIFWGL